MFDEVGQRMRDRIKTRQYVMTIHAEEEMSDDNLRFYDIEQAIFTGEIIKRQKNRVQQNLSIG